MDIKKWLELEENLTLFKAFENLNKVGKTREVIFLCVGSSKVWFDSFGPTIGSLLRHLELEKFIYGNLKANITAKNIEEYVDLIYRFHPRPYIVVFDNAFSKENVGLVIKEGAAQCAAFAPNSTAVGDLSILFNVTKEFMRTPDNYEIMKKAIKKVARFLHFALNQHRERQEGLLGG